MKRGRSRKGGLRALEPRRSRRRGRRRRTGKVPKRVFNREDDPKGREAGRSAGIGGESQNDGTTEGTEGTEATEAGKERGPGKLVS